MSVPDHQGYESNTKIYVGNLADEVTEDFLRTLVRQIAECKEITMVTEHGVAPYAFIEFGDSYAASNAIAVFNNQNILGKRLKVHWATKKHQTPRRHISEFSHVYVGELPPKITQEELLAAFSDFGEIVDCKIMKDPVSLRSKGYAFISFMRREDAHTAIQMMNGQWLISRYIKTGWGARKRYDEVKASYEEVARQTSSKNRTVYVGGIAQNCSIDLMKQFFDEFGRIELIRAFPEKGFAFITYESKDSAVKAIMQRQGTDILGNAIKCSWSKCMENELEQLESQNPSEVKVLPLSLETEMAISGRLELVPPGQPDTNYTGGGPRPTQLTDNGTLINHDLPEYGRGPLNGAGYGPLNGPCLNRMPVLCAFSGGFPCDVPGTLQRY